MKKTLLPAFAILFIIHPAFTQNAYYDALEMMKWYRMKDNNRQKSEKADIILGKMLKYSGSRSAPLANSSSNIILAAIYKKADSLYSYKKRYEIPEAEIIQSVLQANDSLLTPELKDLKQNQKTVTDEYENFSLLVSDYEKKYKQYLARSNNPNPLRLAVNKLSAVFPLGDGRPDFNAFYASDSFSVLMARSGDSILREVFLPELNRRKDEIKKNEKKIYDVTIVLPTNKIRRIVRRLNLVAEELGRTELESSVLLAKAAAAEPEKNDIQEGSKPEQLADLNFPSQSEIIDAIAIYLARRVKQEATLSFIENLNRIIKTDELAQDLFPQTWQLMQTEEAYNSPRFNTQWRNSIAADYLSLPQNILVSKFISNRIADENLKKYFNDVVTFGSYVARKYNFIDITRTLYTDQEKLLKGKWTTVGINVLHILNQEFFDTSKARTWISPQEFFDLQKEDLFCMYDLIRMKYYDGVCSDIKTLFNNIDQFRDRIRPIHKFYTELLTILQQFHVIQFQAFSNKSGKDGFWDTQRTLIELLLRQDLFPLTGRIRQALEICDKGFYVYDYISNKNYVAAADNIIQIVQLLTSQTPKSIINITTAELITLAEKDAGAAALLSEKNKIFRNLLVLRSLKDSLENAIRTKEINIDSVLRPNYVFDRFHFYGDENSIRQLLFTVSSQVKAGSLLQKISSVDTAQSKTIIRDYKALYESIRKSLPDLKRGRFLYRDAKAITENMMLASHHFIKKDNSNYFKWLADFSSLLTEIAGSKDSKSLANVIESYAKPPGSYRVKRNTSFSFDINAYVGAYVAQEKIKGQNNFKTTYGLTAPIGLAFSLGTSIKNFGEAKDQRKVFISKKGILKLRTQNCFTLDLSIIDIGAVVSYRFTDGEDKGLPKKVRWSQVLAPGANIRWGIRNTPLCLGIGVQQTPELRSFNSELKDAFRYQLSFAFDLPLFTIYHSK